MQPYQIKLIIFLARTLPKMAVTRSSSAKKVVRKAVAVKVTKSSGRKYVSWDDTCNQLMLIAFWKKEGHCCPHFSTTLGEWCSEQRQKFQANNPQLSQERIEKLSTIGFQFCLQMKKPKKYLKWDDRYNELVDYKNEHRHANPLFREGQLGRWCINQRQIFQNQFRSTKKASTLYQYQIDKLVDIGFLFNPPQGRPMLQCANLPAIPDLPAWPDMPALPDMPTLPAWLDMPALPEMLPDCVPPLPNVIAV
jgi:hypothetical protein